MAFALQTAFVLAFTDRTARDVALRSFEVVVSNINDASSSGDPLNANLAARLPDCNYKIGIVLVLSSAGLDAGADVVTQIARSSGMFDESQQFGESQMPSARRDTPLASLRAN